VKLYKEGDRLTVSVVFSVVVYAALFLVFQFVVVFPSAKPDPYSGPIFVNIEIPDVLPAPVKTVIETKVDKTKEEKAIGPVTDAVTEKKADAKKDAPPIAKKDTTMAAVKDKATVTKKETTVKDVNTTSEVKAVDKVTTDTTAVTDNGTVPVNKADDAKASKVEESAISKDNLSALDKALDKKDTKEGNAASSGDKTGDKNASSSKGDATPLIQWEDNKDRKPLSMAKPVIPDWVAKQGVRLSVLAAFTLTPQGFLTGIKVEKSSGYTDVDANVVDALRKWKFEAVGGSVNVKGRVTYIISVH
jgi:TonB family protein